MDNKKKIECSNFCMQLLSILLKELNTNGETMWKIL